MIFVMGQSLKQAEIVLAQLHYPKHHATIVTDVTQLRGVTMWTPILFLPGSENHHGYEDVLMYARTSQMCILHLKEDMP